MAQAELAIDGNRFAYEKAVPMFREAFLIYGLPVGTSDPGRAAERIRQRPAAVRDAIFASLEDWDILIPSKSLTPTQQISPLPSKSEFARPDGTATRDEGVQITQ